MIANGLWSVVPLVVLIFAPGKKEAVGPELLTNGGFEEAGADAEPAAHVRSPGDNGFAAGCPAASALGKSLAL